MPLELDFYWHIHRNNNMNMCAIWIWILFFIPPPTHTTPPHPPKKNTPNRFSRKIVLCAIILKWQLFTYKLFIHSNEMHVFRYIYIYMIVKAVTYGGVWQMFLYKTPYRKYPSAYMYLGVWARPLNWSPIHEYPPLSLRHCVVLEQR